MINLLNEDHKPNKIKKLINLKIIYTHFSCLSGCKNKRLAPVLRDLIQTNNFRVVVVDDVEAVEVCGALKVIAIQYLGFVY